MAAAFVAMNDTFGPMYLVSRAEAQTPEMANERANALKGQFVMDMHTHFLRDDTRLENFVRSREAVGKAGWNPALVNQPQSLDDLKFANYFKEIYLDSDTKVALISGSGSEEPRDWFLTDEMKADARADVNQKAGAKRMLSHAIFMPGVPGWLEKVDRDLEVLKPDSFKGCTVGDNTNKQLARHPWKLDDEKLLYPFYEKLARAAKTTPSLANVCVHKGLFPDSVTRQYPNLADHANVNDVAKAAKDWPQLNFIIYHSGYRAGPVADRGAAALGNSGRNAEEIRLCAPGCGRRAGEKRHLRRQLGPALPLHTGATRVPGGRQSDAGQGGI